MGLCGKNGNRVHTSQEERLLDPFDEVSKMAIASSYLQIYNIKISRKINMHSNKFTETCIETKEMTGLPWWWRWVMVFLYIFTNRRELQLFRATKIEDSSSLRLCVSSSMSSSSVHLFIRKQIQEREKKRWGRKRRREYEGIKIQNKRERGGLYCIVM